MPISKKTYMAKEKKPLKTMGFRIQFYRKLAGISQAQLAELADMSTVTIGRLEGTKVVGTSLVGLYRIAKALRGSLLNSYLGLTDKGGNCDLKLRGAAPY